MARIRLIVTAFLVLAALGLRATPTLASGLCPGSEQDIVNAIKSAGWGGTVVLSCPSATTIYFDKSNGHNGNGHPIGIPNVTLDASSSPGAIRLDGGGGVQLFYVDVTTYPGATLGLKHLTLQNGNDAGTGVLGGGAIDNVGGTVTIDDSIVSKNVDSGHGGGAIATNGGTVSVTNSTFSDNSTSTGGGGAIYNEAGTVSLTNSILSGNSSSGQGGGAVYNHAGTLTVTGGTLSGNSTSLSIGGGAVYINGGTATIDSATLSGNVSIAGGTSILGTSITGSGGAIEDWGALTASNDTFANNSANTGGAIDNIDTLNIQDSTFSGNSAPSVGGSIGGQGGAINTSGTASVENTTFVGNSSSANGGAIDNNYGTNLVVLNSTFSGNSAWDGGAIYNLYATASVGASIITGSTGGNCLASVNDYGYNLTDSNGNCGLTASTDLTNTDPQLGPLQDNGGPTQTMALSATSPAMDRVPASTYCIFLCLCAKGSADQRWEPRPDNGESTCDIGAYESDYAVLPTTLAAVSGSGSYAGTAALTATLTWGTTPISGKTITFTVNGSAVCGGAAQPSCPTTDSTGTATLQNVDLTGIDAGTHSSAIGAAFAGDSDYAASSAAGALTVGKANQSINFGTLANHTYGDAPFQVSASSTSGLPVSFSVGGHDQCTLSATTVTITGAGSCTVTANQAGNNDYNPAASVSHTVTIGQGSATIALNTASLTANYDGTPHLATAATTPPDARYSVSYTDGNGNSVSNPTNAGSYNVTASITDPNYAAASVTGMLVIAKASQSISVTGPAPSSAAYNSNFSVTAQASSGLTVTYGSSGSCTNSGRDYIITGSSGACVVTFDQAGNGNYTAAQRVSETVTATKASQNIYFDALPDRTYGDPDFGISAWSDSGLEVSFSASGPCTVSRDPATDSWSVSITGAGTGANGCTITASQPGDSNIDAATSVSQTFSIAKASTTTALTSSATPSLVKQGVTFTVTVASGARIPVGTVTITDGTTTLASGVPLDATGTATFMTSALAAGTHSITASYSGNANFSGSVTSSALTQQVRYAVKVLSTNSLTVTLQLLNYANADVSASNLAVTAECVVPVSATPPTACGTAPFQTITRAFGFSASYKGMGPAYSYGINPHGLTKGQQYDLLVQTGADPVWHAVPFTA